MSDGAASAQALKALERAGWSEKAETYGLLTGRITARLVDPLLDAAGADAGAHVLDVGTGPGYAARRAAERGAVATGVDIAEEMVALARSRNPGIRFLRADAEELPFPDRSFDALVGNLVVNHLPRPDVAVREFVRVLRRELLTNPIMQSSAERTAQRSELNAARTSVVKSSGSSQAAKWPPLSTSLK